MKNSHLLAKFFGVTFVLAVGFSSNLSAQGTSNSVSTPVVGFVTTTLAAGSDTIIAPQVLRPSELSAAVSGVTSTATQATLALSGATLTANQFQYNATTQPNTYFALVTGGNLTGTYFLVSSNTTSEIIVNLDGLTASSADITSIEVRPCWTLSTLFPAEDAGKSFTPSADSSGAQRRTTILMPNFAGTGVNRASAATYFYNNAVGVQSWVSTTAVTTKAGDTAVLPGSYVILRNTGGTPVQLSFTHSGAVLASKLTSYLGTLTNASSDTLIALPRPTDYTLSQIGLTTNNFMPSSSSSGADRRDTLLVVSPTGTGVNRASSATYFLVSTNWYSTTATSTPTNNAVVPAGSALIIRKFRSDGSDKVFDNNLNVSL